jgi:hypothetical protein
MNIEGLPKINVPPPIGKQQRPPQGRREKGKKEKQENDRDKEDQKGTRININV